MSYLRLSLVTPKRGHERRAAELLDRLAEYYTRQPGYLTGFRLRTLDGARRLGRITVWEAQHYADAAANTPHDLALRSEMNLVVEPSSHREHAFEATAVASALGRRALA